MGILDKVAPSKADSETPSAAEPMEAATKADSGANKNEKPPFLQALKEALEEQETPKRELPPGRSLKGGLQVPPRDPRPLPRPLSSDRLAPYKAVDVRRDKDGRWLAGAPGGGKGQRTGLVDYARFKTDDGLELVDHALGIMRGWVSWVDPQTGEVIWERVSVREQSLAREFFADRGILPRVQQIDVTTAKVDGQEADALTRLSPDELRTYMQLLDKLREPEKVVEGQAQRVQAKEACDAPAKEQ